MKAWQKPLALLLAITLLVTCGMAGIMLPASAESTTPIDLFNGLGKFETDSWTQLFSQRGNSIVVDDPTGSGNKVLQLGQFEDDGTFTGCGDAYLNFAHLYDAEAGTYTATIDTTKTYLLSVDVYGIPGGSYAMSGAGWVPGGQSWKKLGNNTSEWTNYQYVFTFNENKSTNYQYNVSISRKGTKDDNEPYSWTYENRETTATYVDNITITEYTYAESMTLNKTEATIDRKGNTVDLAAVAAPAGSHFAETVTWVSSNTAVATVDANGKVTAVGGGTAVITATCGDTMSATCTVTVTDYNMLTNGDFEDGMTSWSLNKNNGSPVPEIGAGYGVNGSAGAKITVQNPNTEGSSTGQWPSVSYTKACMSLLEPNETYIFSFDYKWEGTGVGARFVPLKNESAGWTGNWKKAVYKNTEWTTVTMEFTTNDTIASGPPYEWQVEALMYESQTGTGAAYYDNFKLVKKSALPQLTDIALNKTEATIARKGSTVQLTATAVPAGAYFADVTWESSNTAVATVDATGKVTAVKGGTATITVKSGTVSKSCTVTVTDYSIMTNGDFEDGTASWYSGLDYIVAGQGKDGGTCYYYNRTNASEAPGVSETRYKDALFGKLTPGEEYVFACDYKTTGTAEVQFYFNIDFGTVTGGAWTGSLNAGKYIGNASGGVWITKMTSFTASETSTANPPWEFVVRVGTGSGEAWVDNIRFIKKSDMPALTGVTLNKTEAVTLQKGSTLALTATAAPAGTYFGSLTWESSNTAVATVDKSGVVTAKKGGTAVITATMDTFAASVTVNVPYSVEHFVNGSMDESTTGIDFGTDDAGWSFADGQGVDGGKALALNNGTHYFKNQTIELKPNSYYLYSLVAHTSNGSVATIEIGNAGSGNSNVVDVTSIDNSGRAVKGTAWQPFVNCVKTGDAPSMNSNWNLLIKVSNLANGATLYVDNISFKLVNESETGVLNMDFDTPDWGGNYWNNGEISIVAGEGMNNSNAMVLSNTKGYKNIWRDVNTGLESNALYKVSFYTRATDEWIAANPNAHFMWDGTNAKDAKAYTPNGTQFKATAEWELNEYYIWTGSNTTLPSNVFYLNIASESGEGNLYFDNFTFERVDSGNALVTYASDCTMYVYAGSKPAALPAFLTDVPAGTTVTVEVWEYGGYLMVPGSLVYVKADSTKIPVLNKDNDTFGSGNGRCYQFTKPEGAGRLVCTMQKADTNSFAMDSIGTSIHTNTAGDTNGIRFLTRLAVTDFKVDAENMTVTYNGATATVTEIGSLLVRAGNEDSLTYDNAKWKAVAYKKGEIDTMKLVDYTGKYLDFTVVMMTQYTDRSYSAKGYMCLDTNGDGVADTTVYSTSYQTDSIDTAAARL